MYKTIMVGYDESQYSTAALIEAANWIKKQGGRLIIMHSVFFDTEEFGIAPEQHEKRVKHAEKICTGAKEFVTDEFGIPVSYIISEGEPPEAVAGMALEKEVDLIALGTYGRRGLKRLLMGSVTSKVVIEAPCDVLVVKRPCSECTGEYKSILVPFDGSEFSRKALRRACLLAKTCGADVTALYVIPRYEELLEFFKTEAIKKSLLMEAQKIIDSVSSLAAAQGSPVRSEIAEGQAAEQIIKTAKKLNSNLIVIGSYGYRGVNKAIMGSTAERVIINAPVPVLVAR
ncbi:MAG: universal stress protein [Nitrospirae bacterium]|nr:MAG: universal stress protein [Nitrospirota bacterium]